MLLEMGAAFVAGSAVVSVKVGVPLGAVAAGGLAGALLAWRARRGCPPPDEEPALFPAWWPAILLVFFLPVARDAVAPGADAAMYAALARGLSDGGTALSPAWGNVTADLYPRGGAAMIALLAPIFGWGTASVVAANSCFIFWFLGAAWFLRASRTPGLETWRNAAGWGATLLLISHSPQMFFPWGGSTTACASGLGLLGVALAVVERSRATLALAVLLMAGSVATHPVGAVAPLLTVPWLLAARWSEARHFLGRLALALGAWVAMAGALAMGGPVVSPAEAEWIRKFLAQDTGAIKLGPEFRHSVWLDVRDSAERSLLKLARWSALILLVLRPRLVLRSAFWLGSVLAVQFVGPRLPEVGLLFYPSRLMPMIPLAMAPLLAAAARGLRLDHPLLRPLVLVGLVALAGRHPQWYQDWTPLATANDVALLSRAEGWMPPGSMAEGAYGDAAQWLPALAGRAMSGAHAHCTLFDEIREERQRFTVEFLVVGEDLHWVGPADLRLARPPPLDQEGSARLYRLRKPMPPGPPTF